ARPLIGATRPIVNVAAIGQPCYPVPISPARTEPPATLTAPAARARDRSAGRRIGPDRHAPISILNATARAANLRRRVRRQHKEDHAREQLTAHSELIHRASADVAILAAVPLVPGARMCPQHLLLRSTSQAEYSRASARLSVRAWLPSSPSCLGVREWRQLGR